MSRQTTNITRGQKDMKLILLIVYWSFDLPLDLFLQLHTSVSIAVTCHPLLCSNFLTDKTFHHGGKLIKTQDVLKGGETSNSCTEAHWTQETNSSKIPKVLETDQLHQDSPSSMRYKQTGLLRDTLCSGWWPGRGWYCSQLSCQENILCNLLTCLKLFSVLQVPSFGELSPMFGWAFVMQLSLIHWSFQDPSCLFSKETPIKLIVSLSWTSVVSLLCFVISSGLSRDLFTSFL